MKPRYRALISLVYAQALSNRRVQSNPARLVRALREDNAGVRFLGFDEGQRLFAVLRDDCPGAYQKAYWRCTLGCVAVNSTASSGLW